MKSAFNMDILGLGLIYINDWLLLTVILCSVIWKYYTWHFDLFISRGIDGPKPKFFFVNLLEFRSSVPEHDLRLDRQYGETYGYFQGRTPLLMTRNPEILRHVFVKDHLDFINRQEFGSTTKFSQGALTVAKDDHWKTLRNILSPTFSTSKLKLMTPQICQCAQVMVNHLEKDAALGESLEVKSYVGAFTMDTIAKTAFGLELDSKNDENSQFVAMACKGFSPLTGESFPLPLMAVLFAPFLLPILGLMDMDMLPKDVRDFFADVIDRIIDAREETKQERVDFIQLMMNAHKEELDKEDDDDKDFHDANTGPPKRKLTRDEIITQGVLFFIAGYETTAQAIAFLVYNLALNPEYQEKLKEEIDSVIGDKPVDYEALSELKLLDMCINESLRMYPPVMRTDRESKKNAVVCGIDIPKGVIVSVPIWVIHHDSKIWPEPEKFNPYRFTPDGKSKHGPFDWLPFGAGPRNCIAMKLALTEIKISVLYLVRNFKIIQTEKTEVPITLRQSGLVAAKNGIWVKFEKRVS